jgi:hypothetical protein
MSLESEWWDLFIKTIKKYILKQDMVHVSTFSSPWRNAADLCNPNPNIYCLVQSKIVRLVALAQNLAKT